MKTIEYYESPFEAEVVKGLPESEGITDVRHNGNLTGVLPHLANDLSVQSCIVVSDKDYEWAGGVIRPHCQAGCQTYKVVCPECGSEEISSGGGADRRSKILRQASLPL